MRQAARTSLAASSRVSHRSLASGLGGRTMAGAVRL